VENDGSVHAVGGSGGPNYSHNMYGGAGGDGRIRVDANELRIGGVATDPTTFTNTTNPPVGYTGTP